MSTEVLVAIVAAGGVVGGATLNWGLQELTAWWKARRAEKGELGLLLTELLRFHREIVTLTQQVRHCCTRTDEENNVDVAGNRAFDATLQYLSAPEKLYAALENTKKLVARRNPIAAMSLDGVLYAVQQLNMEDHPRSARQQLAAVVLGFEQGEAHVRRLILQLAWLHSPITRIRLRRSQWTTSKLVAPQARQPGSRTV